LRPTSDRVRESLFNILSHYGQPSGARVLDLFAGTGALGLEALSRGATHVTYVENGRAGQKLILENLTKARRTQDAALLKSDATSLPPAKVPCNLVFLDPPYGKALGEQALASARAQGWLSEDALVVWEESAPMYAPQGFTLEDQRKYGSTVITLLRA
jgi:16S rRNA (guanine966-N2)-methyltransferase